MQCRQQLATSDLRYSIYMLILSPHRVILDQSLSAGSGVGAGALAGVFAVAVPFFDPDEAPCSAPISAAKSSVFPVPLGFAPEAVELPLLPVLWFPPLLFVPLFMIVIPELPPTFVVCPWGLVVIPDSPPTCVLPSSFTMFSLDIC